MNRAIQNLPDTYYEAGTLDVSKNTRLLLMLNLAGLVVLIIAGWLFLQAIIWLRPEEALSKFSFFSIQTPLEMAGLILAIIGLTALNLIFHEAIHGVFFWIFTRSNPRFAFRGAYAYAAAPGWYLPRNSFLVTTLAPLLIISLAGLIVMCMIPATGLAATWFIVSMNASGAVGDMLVAWWVLRRTPRSYIQDRGDAVTLYLPKNS